MIWTCSYIHTALKQNFMTLTPHNITLKVNHTHTCMSGCIKTLAHMLIELYTTPTAILATITYSLSTHGSQVQYNVALCE